MDKVLVIGGAGFIGSHTADALSDQGFDVTISDNHESSWLRDDQSMIIGDILNVEDVKNAVSGCRYVYHLLMSGLAPKGTDLESIKMSKSPQINRKYCERVVGGLTNIKPQIIFLENKMRRTQK